MSWTHDQKMGASLLSLTAYKNSLPPNDPDLPKATEHVQWRNDCTSVMTANNSKLKGGFAPGQGLETPPPPPNP